MFYFAYGSNMDEDRLKKRMTFDAERYRGIPHGKYKILGSVYTKGYRLVFNKRGSNGSGKANLIDDPKCWIEGILYKLDQNGINRLDINEGVTNGDYYRCDNFEVFTKQKSIKCSIYLSNKLESGLKPTKKYLCHLLKGKPYLSTEYYNKLLKVETSD